MSVTVEQPEDLLDELRAEAALLEDVVAGRLTIDESTDWRRVHELVEQ